MFTTPAEVLLNWVDTRPFKCKSHDFLFIEILFDFLFIQKVITTREINGDKEATFFSSCGQVE